MENNPEKIELHHHTFDEIMGTPPVRSITKGSGMILILLMVLLVASQFVYTPSILRTNAVIYGQTPLAVLKVPQSGFIVFQDEIPSKWNIIKDDTVCSIQLLTFEEEFIHVLAPLKGVFEINPLVKIRKNVVQNDTIGIIWNETPSLVVCVLQLPNVDALNVHIGQKIRVFINVNESKDLFEAEISEKTKMNTSSYTQLIAILNGIHFQENDFRGVIDASVEIITGQKNLFQQLINPFRGLKK
jgi:hypothetical protein